LLALLESRRQAEGGIGVTKRVKRVKRVKRGKRVKGVRDTVLLCAEALSAVSRNVGLKQS
jgi:hypothetical protein